MIEGWKGPAKSVGLAAAGFAVVGAALHGLFGRANKVTVHDEEEAQEIVDDGGREDGSGGKEA